MPNLRYEVINWLRARQEVLGNGRLPRNTGVSGLLTLTKSIKPSSLYEWMMLHQFVITELLEAVEN